MACDGSCSSVLNAQAETIKQLSKALERVSKDNEKLRDDLYGVLKDAARRSQDSEPELLTPEQIMAGMADVPRGKDLPAEPDPVEDSVFSP